MMRIVSARDSRVLDRLLAPAPEVSGTLLRRVRTIVNTVRRRGDAALLAYARRFDGLDGDLMIPPQAMRAAARALDPAIAGAIGRAAANIRRVARRQLPRSWSMTVRPGVSLEHRVVPLTRVGCYVPAGRFPLPSSLLMTAVPARMAGVEEIVVICPRPDAAILCAALEAGVDRVLRIGGAHGIAALAYGTQTVARVDKIVGPGSAYVAAAKRLVSPDCPIDVQAGPSEIVVISASGNPAWIAADLAAQAEHDPQARALLITPSKTLAQAVLRELRHPGGGAGRMSLTRRSAIVLTASMDEAVALANRLAPEHVVVDDDRVAEAVTCAGALFVGRWSAQAAGDYMTGSNHVLPTGGAARLRGGLSATDFVRHVSVQRVTRAGLRSIAADTMALAGAEGLSAHARSIAVRVNT